MKELTTQMSKVMKSTRNSGLIVGEALKSILKRLNEGGK